MINSIWNGKSLVDQVLEDGEWEVEAETVDRGGTLKQQVYNKTRERCLCALSTHFGQEQAYLMDVMGAMRACRNTALYLAAVHPVLYNATTGVRRLQEDLDFPRLLSLNVKMMYVDEESAAKADADALCAEVHALADSEVDKIKSVVGDEETGFNVQCAKCEPKGFKDTGHKIAEVPRSGDEPAILWYKCTRCNNLWRTDG